MLTVFEVYESIQGESTHAGRPCIFVRLAACDLRCAWCDTPYAFTGGAKMSIEDVLERIRTFRSRLVELTGGEPLLQKDAGPLMQRLLDERYEVLLETGGHVPLDAVPRAVRKIVDVKCPGSGEAGRMHWPNLEALASHDEVKFVIADRADFDYAHDVVRRHHLVGRVAAVLFSPVHGVLNPQELGGWILDAALPVRLQLQLHKYIWTPETRGV
jgi:7-carboxy-7-deazaguanine synthase